MIYSDYIIRTPPKHPFSRENSSDYIIRTVSAQILNMFVTWIVILENNINLSNSHPFVLSHCYMFLVKNQVFGLLDQIAPKLPLENQKKFKDHDSLRRGFLQDSAPQNPKFHRLDPFFIFFKFFIFSEKSEKICISFI